VEQFPVGVVWIAEDQCRVGDRIIGVVDSAVRHALAVESGSPGVQFCSGGDGQCDVIEAGLCLAEGASVVPFVVVEADRDTCVGVMSTIAYPGTSAP
jgi:hypothetical protein